jgi:hypothetical protein
MISIIRPDHATECIAMVEQISCLPNMIGIDHSELEYNIDEHPLRIKQIMPT